MCRVKVIMITATRVNVMQCVSCQADPLYRTTGNARVLDFLPLLASQTIIAQVFVHLGNMHIERWDNSHSGMPDLDAWNAGSRCCVCERSRF